MASDQIHLEASEYTKLVDSLWEDLQKKEYFDVQGKVARAIRFFGKNLMKLVECNDTMLKLGNIYVMVMEEKLIEWSLRDSHAFLLLITSLLLKRKDEVVIRQAALIMRDFAKLVPEQDLKNLVKLNAKVTKMMVHKLSRVATQYTQFKIVEMLHVVFEGSEEAGAKTFRTEKNVAACKKETIEEAVKLFNQIDTKKFLDTATEFLNFFDGRIISTPFIRTFRGFLQRINSQKLVKTGEISIDFNLRNLSVSCFASSNGIRNIKTKKDEVMYFLELESCEVVAKHGKFKNLDHVEFTVKPARYQVMDVSDSHVKNLHKFDSITFVVIDSNKMFQNQVFPLYESKTPLPDDNMTDNDSLVSFRTIKSSIVDDDYIMRRSLSQNQHVEDKNKPIEEKLSFEGRGLTRPEWSISEPNLSEDLFPEQIVQSTAETVEPEPEPVKQPVKPFQPRRSIAIVAANKKAVNYDEVPSDDEQPMTLSQIRKQKQNERLSQIASQQSENVQESASYPDNSDKTWLPRSKPAPRKKRTQVEKKPVAKSEAKPRTRTKKNKVDQEEDEIEEQILQEFGDALHPKDSKLPPFKGYSKNKKPTVVQDLFEDESSDEIDRIVMNNLPERPSISRGPRAGVSSNVSEARRAAIAKAPAESRKAVKRQAFADENEPPKIKIKKSFDQLLQEDKPKQVEKPKRAPVNTSHQVANSKVSVVNPRAQKPVTKAAYVEEPVEVDFDEADDDVEQTVDIFKTQTIHAKKMPDVQVKKSSEVQVKKASYTPIARKEIKQSVEVQKQPAAVNKPIPLPAEKYSVAEQPLETKRKKRVSFGEPSSYMMRAVTPSVRSYESNMSIPSHQPSKPVINYEAIKNKDLMKSFLDDTSIASPVIENDDSFDNVIIEKSQTVQQVSPTMIRTVHFQEITYSPPVQRETQQMVPHRSSDMAIPKGLLDKAEKKMKPILNEVAKLRDSIGAEKNADMKQQLRSASEKSRESNIRLKNHVQEHVKLLKRLQHSKSKFMQLKEESDKNAEHVCNIHKQLMVESRSSLKAKVVRVMQIEKEAEAAEKEAKKEMWTGYVQNISKQIQTMLQSHLEF